MNSNPLVAATSGSPVGLSTAERSLIGERAAQKVAMRGRCALLLGRGDTACIRLKRKGPWALPA